MLKTLKNMFGLRKAYKSNSILYVLRQLPLIKKILPPALSVSKPLNIIVTTLYVIGEILNLFMWKALYYFGVFGYLRSMSDTLPSDVLFCQTLLICTIIGLLMNVDFLSYKKDKFYAINIFKINAKQYTLIDLMFSLSKIIVGSLPIVIYLGLSWGIPLWFCIAIPFCVAFGKFIFAAYVLVTYDKTGVVNYAGKSLISWLVALLLGLAGFVMPLLEKGLPKEPCMAGVLLLLPVGLVCAIKVFTYKNYLKINKSMLSQVDLAMKEAKKRGNKTIESSIDDASVTSNKSGFEYFNELFMKRHKKILWKPALNMTIVIAAFAVIVNVGILFVPDGRQLIAKIFDGMIPYFSFIAYTISRGEPFTKALFMNCDDSMLTFSFYKKRNNVLKLFCIRLREIVKVNIVPGLALGIALGSFVFIPGDMESVKKGLLIILTMTAESILFSVHFLMLYYLLQPYNVNTEVKGVYYTIIKFAAYILIYLLMFQHIPIATFGVACLVFCVVYSAIACLLVAMLAPRTFKLKN